MPEAVIRDRRGPVEVWTINDPATRNAITGAEFVSAIEKFATEANADLDVRAVILTGAGTVFSSGGNVKEMKSRTGMFAGDPVALRQNYRNGIQRVARAMTALEMPLIAAVNGAAIGAGCDLALMSDIRIASERASFAESFVKLGLIPGDGGAWLLQHAIGRSRAAEMTFLGEAINASIALAWGLVSRVVPPADLMPEAFELAERIAANPPHALRMSKALLRESQSLSFSAALELSAAMQAIVHHTPDHEAALSAGSIDRAGGPRPVDRGLCR